MRPRLRAATLGGSAPRLRLPPGYLWNKDGAGADPLCRPAGWVALWKRLAMVGKLNARAAG